MLRREVLDADGDVVRFASRSCACRRATATRRRRRRFAPKRRSASRSTTSTARTRIPRRAGDGFRLIGRWQHSDDLAQLYYSDGVLSVSVFEQPGHLDWDTLPDGGVGAEVNGRAARRYALPVGEAWVFERGGVVYTCVGDASDGRARAISRHDVSRPDENRVERLAQMVVDPFRW